VTAAETTEPKAGVCQHDKCAEVVMNRFCIVSLWLSLTTIASSYAQAPALPNEAAVCTDEDYAIFAAALDDLYGAKHVEHEVLLDHTSTGTPPGLVGTTQLAGKAEAFFRDVPQHAKDNFEVRNKGRRQVEIGKIKTPFEISSLSPEEAERLVRRKDGWGAFHRKYSKAFGITILSLPGVNDEHNRAVLYVGTSCGTLCGGGSLLYLSNENGEWKVINAVTIWQS
jgi:hypothetical protein